VGYPEDRERAEERLDGGVEAESEETAEADVSAE
jgi:hypothetical protein